MTITWHGGSTVTLVKKGVKALLNPSGDIFDKATKLIVYDKTSNKHKENEGVLMVDWPGEYDVSGFAFVGVVSNVSTKSHIVYSFHFPEGNVAWVGDMSDYPSEDSIERLGEVHVLLLPVGGGDVLKAKDAFRLVEALEPAIVIPICYGGKRSALQPFLKEMDVKLPEAKKSYELKRNDLGGEHIELVILEDI